MALMLVVVDWSQRHREVGCLLGAPGPVSMRVHATPTSRKPCKPPIKNSLYAILSQHFMALFLICFEPRIPTGEERMPRVSRRRAVEVVRHLQVSVYVHILVKFTNRHSKDLAGKMKKESPFYLPVEECCHF